LAKIDVERGFEILSAILEFYCLFCIWILEVSLSVEKIKLKAVLMRVVISDWMQI